MSELEHEGTMSWVIFRERFYAKVERSGGPEACWPWTGARTAAGYGAVYRGKRHTTHRVAYYLEHGRWPNICRHTCDNPPCCNPAHLLDGTHADNVRDAVERGRVASKLSPEQVERARAERANGRTAPDIAAELGVDRSTVLLATNGATWKHIGSVGAYPRQFALGAANHTSKLTVETVREARELHAAGWGARRLASHFNVSRSTMRALLLGKTWRHV